MTNPVPKLTPEQVKTLLDHANHLGTIAAGQCEVQLIRVAGHPEAFPICGFAEVKVFGLRGGKILNVFKSHGFRKGYPSGQYLWISQYSQSYDRKLAYAQAYAKALQQAGFRAYASGRLD